MQARKETSLVQFGRRYVLGTVTMIVGAFLLITVPIHHQRSHEDWWILALSFFLLFSGSLVSSLVKRAIRSGIRESRWPESALDRMSRWAYALQPASFALSVLLVGLVALIWVMPKQWPGTRWLFLAIIALSPVFDIGQLARPSRPAEWTTRTPAKPLQSEHWGEPS